MNMRWSLERLYTSFDSKEFKKDMEKIDEDISWLKSWTQKKLDSKKHATSKAEKYITAINKLMNLFSRLSAFAGLTISVDAKNGKAQEIDEILDLKIAELTEPHVAFQKWLSSLDNIDKLISSSEILKEHEFYLKELVLQNKYLLSSSEEVIISKMKNTGSNAWTKLQNLLTSTLLVDITVNGEEKKLPLPVVRNMAYSSDANLRKSAYESEFKAYKKIEESSAACLNGIKGEVITVSRLRGYESPLQKTLFDSRMDRETLDALLAAMRESLPHFRKFYRKKGEMLGYKNGLPMYDIFAPVGNIDMKFTYEEARDYIITNFSTFSDKLADYAKKAFDNSWIDAEPREGKRGGAFCSNIHAIKESRILANFTGNFSNVTTLAHELGHGYHGECLKDEHYLNSDYPMPIAETASTFCETIVMDAAIKSASKGQAITLLEQNISDAGQVIVDIYSRFLFESELFSRRLERSPTVEELKEMMLKAQKDAYGDGLDHGYLHPYMWINKPHYYYAGSNFYNFPYPFGLLFAKGLYLQYKEKGRSFVAQYDKLLSVTGRMNTANVAKTAGIDVHSVDFWRSSLKLIEDDIDRFINLING